MHKLEIRCQGGEYSFAVGSRKIFFGGTSDIPFRLFLALENAFGRKEMESEFSCEREQKTRVLLNDSEVGRREGMFFRIDPYWDMEKAMAMQSSSLFLKYAEARLSGIEYDETFSTFSLLYDRVREECLGDLADIDVGVVRVRFGLRPMGTHWLVKNIEIETTKEDLSCSKNDLSLKEIVRMQARMIRDVAKSFPGKVFVAYDGPFMRDMIEEMSVDFGEAENILLLVSASVQHAPLADMTEYAFCGSVLVDGFDCERLAREIGDDLPFHTCPEEWDDLLHGVVSGRNDEKTRIIREYLSHLRV